MSEVTIEVEGERLALLPERLVWWERKETLLVADPHWGKAATFRARGIPVPSGTTGEGLTRLDVVLARTAARRIIFLGDYLHAREGRAPGTLRALAAWREAHPELSVLLIRGNHDRHAGDPPLELGIVSLDPPIVDLPFVLAHYPDPSSSGYVLAGHLHPAVRLAGRGRQRARLPCFWFREHVAVLPSFGDFTGSADVWPEPGERVFVVAEDRVLEIG
jgi:DNA ligase-associated metallophosphoesterase